MWTRNEMPSHLSARLIWPDAETNITVSITTVCGWNKIKINRKQAHESITGSSKHYSMNGFAVLYIFHSLTGILDYINQLLFKFKFDPNLFSVILPLLQLPVTELHCFEVTIAARGSCITGATGPTTAICVCPSISITVYLIAHRFFVLFFSFWSFLFDSCDRLSWFNQLLNCTLNPCTLLSFFYTTLH